MRPDTPAEMIFILGRRASIMLLCKQLLSVPFPGGPGPRAGSPCPEAGISVTAAAALTLSVFRWECVLLLCFSYSPMMTA